MGLFVPFCRIIIGKDWERYRRNVRLAISASRGDATTKPQSVSAIDPSGSSGSWLTCQTSVGSAKPSSQACRVDSIPQTPALNYLLRHGIAGLREDLS